MERHIAGGEDTKVPVQGHDPFIGIQYVPPDLFKLWEMKDPIKNFEHFLIESGVLKEIEIGDIRNAFKEKIESEYGFANNCGCRTYSPCLPGYCSSAANQRIPRTAHSAPVLS